MLEHGKRIQTRTHACTHSANVPKKCHLKQHKIDVCWNHSNDHAMVTLFPFRLNCVSLRLNKMSFCFRQILLKCPMFTGCTTFSMHTRILQYFSCTFVVFWFGSSNHGLRIFNDHFRWIFVFIWTIKFGFYPVWSTSFLFSNRKD